LISPPEASGAYQGATTMGDEANRDGLQQQPADDQRRQADQQNQQGETRTPQQQREDEQRRQSDQQNQQGERREDDAELNRARTNPLDDGLEGGVDTGAIQPGKTDQR
jgi:hypothetical protein